MQMLSWVTQLFTGKRIIRHFNSMRDPCSFTLLLYMGIQSCTLSGGCADV